MTLTDALLLLSLYLGDFNLEVQTLDTWPQLREQGFVALDEFHVQQESFPMPFTCKDATRPDMVLVRPLLADRISGIRVEPTEMFDYFQLAIPDGLLVALKIRYPQSWLQYGLEKEDLQRVVDQDNLFPDPAGTHQEWGDKVEHMVRRALQAEAVKNFQFHLPAGLPRKCRGRCKPVKRVLCPLRPLCKPLQHGAFQPQSELLTFQSRQLLTQIRRVESLRGRLCHVVKRHLVPSAEVWEQLQQEWQAILDHRVQGKSFIQLVRDITQLMPCPRFVPGQELFFLNFNSACGLCWVSNCTRNTRSEKGFRQ